MIFTIIGLLLNFAGSLALTIETISGGTIRHNIYSNVYNGVHQFTNDHTLPIKIKLEPKEERVLCWMFLTCVGFLLQVLDFIVSF